MKLRVRLFHSLSSCHTRRGSSLLLFGRGSSFCYPNTFPIFQHLNTFKNYATLIQHQKTRNGTKINSSSTTSIHPNLDSNTSSNAQTTPLEPHIPPLSTFEIKTQFSKSGKIYNELDYTPGLQALISKSRILQRELNKSMSTVTTNTKVQYDTDASLRTLLIRSITHASFGSGKVRTHDRLAYMGQHVLDLVLTEIISHKYMSHVKGGNSQSPSTILLGNTITNSGGLFIDVDSPHAEQVNSGRERYSTASLLKAIYNNRSYLAFVVANEYWNFCNHHDGASNDKTPLVRFKNMHQQVVKYPSSQPNVIPFTMNTQTTMNETSNTCFIENEHYTLRCVNWNEMTTKGQREITSNAVLAIIGSLYAKCGLSVAREFIEEEIIRDRPSQVFKKLLFLDEPQLVLSDLVGSYYHYNMKFVEEYVKSTNCFKCTLFVKHRVIGDANAKDAFKARKLACFDGLMRLQSMIPNY
nr:unnamed protein product [Naegleria fowleri]